MKNLIKSIISQKADSDCVSPVFLKAKIMKICFFHTNQKFQEISTFSGFFAFSRFLWFFFAFFPLASFFTPGTLRIRGRHRWFRPGDQKFIIFLNFSDISWNLVTFWYFTKNMKKAYYSWFPDFFAHVWECCCSTRKINDSGCLFGENPPNGLNLVNFTKFSDFH